ncbi:hypothetical protein KRX19_08775 [Cardiobacteriaceae bacterium TAE3-ERU3]|nr:hypothetical protein [Cardiobacteriaceae bacterium TAE3-ERU3]
MIAILLFILVPCASALTLRVSIDNGQMLGNSIDGFTAVVKGDEHYRHWQLEGSADALHYQGERFVDAKIFATAVIEQGDFDLQSVQISGRWRDTLLGLDAESLLFKGLMTGQFAWPEGMAVQFSADGRGIKAQGKYSDQILSSTLDGTIPQAWLHEALKAAGLDVTGTLTPNLSVTYKRGRFHIRGDVGFRGVNWSNADALYAVEKLGGRLMLDVSGVGQSWRGSIDVKLDDGEALATPLYFNLNQLAKRLRGNFDWQAGGLSISDAEMIDEGVSAHFGLTYDGSSSSLAKLHVNELSGDAGVIYTRYVQPFLSDTLLDDAEVSGVVFAAFDWQFGKLGDVAVVFNHVSIEDKQSRFKISDIDGQFGKGDHTNPSVLRFGPIQWRGLPLGVSSMYFTWDEKGVELLKPWRIPLFDGALILTDLRPVEKNGYQMSARIEPIDIAQIAQALDLLPFQGEVSGEFPNIRINKDQMFIGAPIYLRLFDGNVEVRDFRIAGLFSGSPLLYFDIAIDHIDLQRLTHALQVGEIQGRLSGFVRDVALLNWQPQQFDAALETPKQNAGRRQISHEAVQYLSEAGGGSEVVGSFVEMLNQFPYEKLGVHALLTGGVLNLNGVEPAPNGGYYLVKGRGLPHLDIIGYGHKVDWDELLARLKAAAESDGAVIE